MSGVKGYVYKEESMNCSECHRELEGCDRCGNPFHFKDAVYCLQSTNPLCRIHVCQNCIDKEGK